MQLTRAEWQLMNALWQGHPASAREIIERLPKRVDWAYTTVKTMLTRLVAKGALSEKKQGNVGVYTPMLSQHKARLMAVRSLVGDAFDGAFGSLAHFLVEEEALSQDEVRCLLDLVKQKPQRRRKP